MSAPSRVGSYPSPVLGMDDGTAYPPVAGAVWFVAGPAAPDG